MKGRSLAIAFAIALSMAIGETSARHELTIGNSAVVVKTVTGKLGPDIRTLILNDDVYHNELIETLEDSATEIIFLDNTKITLGEQSQIILDKFIYDPNPTRSQFVLTVSKGAMRFVSGNLPSESYTIHTPSGTVGIRGTIVDFYVTPAVDDAGRALWRTEVTFQDGVSVEFACAGERRVLRKPGQSVVNESDGITCSNPAVQPQSPQSRENVGRALAGAASESADPGREHAIER